MLAVEEITPVAGEQKLIEELSEGLAPLHRDDLPHHNFGHSHDKVLPEVIRLDGLQPVSASHGRLNLIAAALGHDAGVHLPDDPERHETKEARTTRLIRPILVQCGYGAGDIAEIDGLVLSTQADAVCETPGQVKLRRADIANVGGRRVPFLATTVNIFHETTILARERGHEAPAWRPFVNAQQRILFKLLSQDLSLGDEPVIMGKGPFNRAAARNAGWLSRSAVQDPARFRSAYDRHLRGLVSEEALAAIA